MAADRQTPAGGAPSGGAWAIPLLCAGLALIACCLLIPAADANRRLTWEQEKLRRDADYVARLVAANDEFLRRFGTDSTLAERLAVRQLGLVPQGTRSLEVAGREPFAMSPFALVRVEAPAPMPAYQPIGGRLTELCCRPESRLLLTAGGLMLVAIGLIGGGGRGTQAPAEPVETLAELPGDPVPFE